MVQAVLVYGSETWVLDPATLQRLEGVHVKAACRMTGMLPKLQGETWRYTKPADLLKVTSTHYVQVQRQSIARWIVERPIFAMCRREEMRRGTTQ